MSDSVIRVPNVQVAFLDKALTKTAPKGTNNDPKHTVAVVFDGNNVPAEINELINSAIREKFPNGLPEGSRPPIRREKKAWLPEGKAFINASSAYCPQIFDRATGEEITMPNDPRLKSGAFCDVLINSYGYDKAGNRGVGYGLNGILVHDTPFEEFRGSGGVDAAAMFGVGGTQHSTQTTDNTSTSQDSAW